jgi:hypothetical protein
MGVGSLFKTTTSKDSPLDASRGDADKPGVSDFLTVQSFTNFAAMTGAITASWHSLQRLSPCLSNVWVPYGCAFTWGIISILISLNGLKTGDKIEIGTILQTIFVGFINSLVLAGAVVGTELVVPKS